MGTWRTQLRPKGIVAALVLSGSLLGCGSDNAWKFRADNVYSDNIQELVEEKIDHQSSPRTGAERWDRYRRDEYQDRQELDRDAERVEIERQRWQAADRLLRAGPVSLADCLVASLEFNDRLRAGRAVVRSMGGEELIAQSRFLPRLTYDLTASVAQNVGQHVGMGGEAIQTLLEFGKDNPIDVSLRSRQRRALFGYERDVAEVLSEVRVRFFTVLLRKGQLAERRKLRSEFLSRHKEMVTLENERRVPEVDVLTARLNVLNEEARINALEKEILRQKMDLLHAAGLPVGKVDFELAGAAVAFDVAPDESVDVAFRRSTRIAQARAVVWERDRVVRQLIWEYFPQFRMQGGYHGSDGAVAVDLESNDNVYGMNAFAERQVDPWNNNTFSPYSRWLGADRSGWRWAVDLQLPIFTGLERTGRYRRDRALLDQDRHLLCDEIWKTELGVRKAYQTMLEQARQTEILAETVQISRKRLQVQEQLKELGKISDNELETFRQQFFSDQDDYFEQQIRLMQAQERLRLAMRYFEPVPAKGHTDESTEQP